MSHLVYCMHATAKGGDGCREHYKIPPLPLYTLRGIEPRLAKYMDGGGHLAKMCRLNAEKGNRGKIRQSPTSKLYVFILQ